MDENDILHLDPKVICTCRDVEKLTDVAKSAGDTFLELVKLLPSPIRVNSKVYKSLEAIRRLPIECVTRSYADVGVQVDFNQDPETIIEEANTCDEYEIINIPSDTYLYGNTETTQDNVDKSHDIMETKQYGDASTNQCPAIYKHQPSECDTSNVESDREIDIDNDTEPMSMSSNNDSTRTLGHYSDTEDTAFNTNPNGTLHVSDEVGTHDVLRKQDTNEKNSIEKGQEAIGIEIQGSDNAHKPSDVEFLKRHADPDQVTPDVSKKRRAEGLISAAQDAFSIGDIINAVKLAKKAIKVNPSEETNKILEKIRNRTFQINAERKENADPNVTKTICENQSKSDIQSEKFTTLLNKVKECLSSGRLDDAEQALGDVRDCNPHPTEDVKCLESQIRAARATRKSTESTQISYTDVRNINPEGKNFPFEEKSSEEKNLDSGKLKNKNYFFENTEKAESLYKQAIDALSKKNYNEAMELAVKSQQFNKLAKVLVLKYDIMKARNNRKSEKSININTIDGYEDARKLDEAVGLVVQARTEIGNKNMKKAEQLLVQPIEICSTESTQKLFKGEREFEPKHDGNIINDGPNYKEAQNCVKVAEDLDFKKDEYFSEKSNRMAPSQSKVVKEMLQDVRVYLRKLGNAQANSDSQQKWNDGISTHEVDNNETDHEYQTAGVEKCIEVAMNAISAEDYNKAERFLKKAEKEQPTKMAKEILADIQKGLKRIQKMRLANDNKAAPLLSLAITTVDKEIYEVAEVLLMNAWIKHKSRTAKSLIKQVQDIVTQAANNNNAGKGKEKTKDWTQIIDEQQRIIAAECIREARNMIAEGHLESAECVLIIAQNTYATNEASEILTSVRYQIDLEASGEQRRSKTKQWKCGTLLPFFSRLPQISKDGIDGRNAFKYNNYVQMAERAYETGDYNVAKEFILEAEKLYPHEDIRKLIKQIKEAKKPYYSKRK